jgi:hypothetical protein
MRVKVGFGVQFWGSNSKVWLVTRSGYTPSWCICRINSIAFCPCPHFTCSNSMAFQETTYRSPILNPKLTPRTLNRPTFWIHVSKRLHGATLNDLLMSTSVLFNNKHSGKCFQHPPKGNRVDKTSACSITRNVAVPNVLDCISHVRISCLSKSPHFMMAYSWLTPNIQLTVCIHVNHVTTPQRH